MPCLGCSSMLTYFKMRGSMGVLWFVAEVMLILACSRRSQELTRSKSSLPRRGDRVLVESNAAQFYEARVISEASPNLRVQAVPSGDAALVQTADVYRLPTKISQLAAQTFAICNVERQRWVACRIVNPRPEGTTARDINENSYDLTWAQVVEANPLTELNLKRLFDKAREQHDFDHDMAKAGPPRTVPGWQPTTGGSVLAKVDGKWWSAVVVSSKRGKIRISTMGTDRSLEVERSDIAPEPPYPMDVSQKSHFALLRPTSVSQAWVPVRLISFDALVGGGARHPCGTYVLWRIASNSNRVSATPGATFIDIESKTITRTIYRIARWPEDDTRGACRPWAHKFRHGPCRCAARH